MWKIIVLIALIFLSGCGDESSCELAAIKEYGQGNVKKLGKYTFVCFDADTKQLLVIEKVGINAHTTDAFDVTDFIIEKMKGVK